MDRVGMAQWKQIKCRIEFQLIHLFMSYQQYKLILMCLQHYFHHRLYLKC
jgi:hypothetical protein